MENIYNNPLIHGFDLYSFSCPELSIDPEILNGNILEINNKF